MVNRILIFTCGFLLFLYFSSCESPNAKYSIFEPTSNVSTEKLVSDGCVRLYGTDALLYQLTTDSVKYRFEFGKNDVCKEYWVFNDKVEASKWQSKYGLGSAPSKNEKVDTYVGKTANRFGIYIGHYENRFPGDSTYLMYKEME